MVELMTAVLILAFAILPIAQFMGTSGTEARKQHSEMEAMQFASDKMDEILMKVRFDDLQTISETTVSLGKTEIKFSLLVVPVPLSNMEPIHVPRIPHHSACGEDTANAGVETNPSNVMSAQIVSTTHLTIQQLDKERLSSLPAAQQHELKDFRLTVKWKHTGAPDRNFELRPIILVSRKARL
jgi:hypothetical protein